MSRAVSDNIQVVQIGKANKFRWDEFVNGSTDGNIFQTFEWAEVMKNVGYGQQVTCLVMSDNGEIIAGILLTTETFKGEILPFFSSSISREGPIIRDEKVNLNPLLNTIDKCFGNRSLVEISLPYYPFSCCYKDSFDTFSYEYTPSSTFLINLAESPEKLWQNLDRNCRHNIRLAEKKGIFTEILSDENDLKKYYELYLTICKRASLTPYNYSLFQTIRDYSKKDERFKIIVVKQNEDIAAGAVMLSHKKKMWYWNAVSDARFKALSAPTLLIWQQIKEGHEKGFRLLDLCGAMCKPDPSHPHYGPDRFKTQFGGKRVPLGRYKKIFHPTFWSLRYKFVIPVYDLYRHRKLRY